MMADVIKLRPADDPDEVLKSANGNYQQLIIVGWNNDGQLDVRATLGMDAAETIYLIEMFKHAILSEAIE